MKTSIIFTSYDLTQTMRQITMKSLENIFKYTDEGYELIWMDTIPKQTFGQVYLNPYYVEQWQFNKRDDRRKIEITDDPGQYSVYNMGAKEAKGEYLCFFQNDVFVPEGWLTDLEWYLDNMLEVDAVFPDQGLNFRETVKKSYQLEHKEAMTGTRDAGILFIRRLSFEKIGGWNEGMKTHFGEGDLYGKLSHFIVTQKPMITHLEHAAGWERALHEWDRYSADTTVSAMLKQGLQP